MYKLDVSRTQWAVGHGFFHTGIVSAGGGAVAHAYDCGSLRGYARELEREIAAAADRLDGIDLFFLSHFDFDHVSGVSAIAAVIQIGTFVIPLVRPEERFFRLAGRLANDDGEQTVPLTADDDYWALLADPVATLGQLAANVVTVEPGGPLDLGDYQSEKRPSPSSVGQAVQSPPSVGNVGQTTAAHCNSDEVWIWTSFVTEAVAGFATYFAGQLQSKGLISSISSLTQADVLATLVLDKRQALVETYRETVEQVGKSFTLNLTSLMLYSGPKPSAGIRTYRSRDSMKERAEIGAWNPHPGWLGCGDADFRARKRRAEFNRVFVSLKRHVGTFAPSHHGSPLDWRPSLLAGFGPKGQSVPVCVFGADGAYKHPGHGVLLEIQGRGGMTVIVSGDERSRWTERMSAFVEP
ncbi:MBL fold metallo-hydrolase [Nocardioides kribbensis]|uniref:MBL fold metallo-hydrolase n=1 Tax=Nocardioides kribbensis TaxID=305517 RepID=A0ABV1NW44_9ACTN